MFSGNIIRNLLVGVSVLLSFGLSYSQDVLKILPLGNSITYDARSLDSRPTGDKISYRYKLYSLLIDNGYNFDFIGSYRSGGNYFDDCDNSGFKGIETKDLADLIQTGTSTHTGKIVDGPYLNYYPADIILLEIGTNDVYYNKFSVSEITRLLNAVDQYEQLSGKPVLVIVGTIISFQNYPCNSHTGVKQFNDNLEAMINTRIAGGDKLIICDLECGAGIDYYNNMWDQVHPNPTGYDKMGIKWFNTINAINAKPIVGNIPNQTIAEGGNFTVINLDNYVSDSDDADAAIVWTTDPAVPEHFTVSIQNRIATIAPRDAEWNGSETITFIASDPGKYIPALHGTDSDAATFEITPVNDVPIIVSQINPVAIDEDTMFEILLDNVNIFDPDDPLSNLSLIVLPGTNYNYSGNQVIPDTDYHGVLNVNIKVSDGKSQSETFIFTIDVIHVNDPPVITTVPIVQADDYIRYTYKFTAIDPENQEIIYSAVALPGWLEFSPTTGILSGIPKYNDIGTSDIILQASDGEESTQHQFSIYVADINDAPVITSMPNTYANVGTSWQYTINATDVDEDDILEFDVVKKPDWILYSAGQKMLSGLPEDCHLGFAPVEIIVTDGRDTIIQQFDLTINPSTGINDPNKNHGLLIYPNPAVGIVHVEYPDGFLLNISIYNLTGTMVYSKAQESVSSSATINISEIPEGIYILKVNSTAGLLVTKLLVL
jgi:hypothetical protein